MTIPEIIEALKTLQMVYEEANPDKPEALGVAIDVLSDRLINGHDGCSYCSHAKRLRNGWIHGCELGEKLPDLSHCKFEWRGKEKTE